MELPRLLNDRCHDVQVGVGHSADSSGVGHSSDINGVDNSVACPIVAILVVCLLDCYTRTCTSHMCSMPVFNLLSNCMSDGVFCTLGERGHRVCRDLPVRQHYLRPGKQNK